jgi:hypothetical protein
MLVSYPVLPTRPQRRPCGYALRRGGAVTYNERSPLPRRLSRMGSIVPHRAARLRSLLDQDDPPARQHQATRLDFRSGQRDVTLVGMLRRANGRKVGRRAERNECKPDWASVLLRARRERPYSRAAEQRDELPPPHSITSSARASSVGGTSRPNVSSRVRGRRTCPCRHRPGTS